MQDISGKSVDRTRVTLLLLLSISMVSSASVLIKMSASDALVITFWRTLYGAIMMASIGAAKGDLSEFRGPVLRKNWVWLVLIGFILSLHFSTWFTSLKLTTIAASVMLVHTAPITTAILSTVILGESLRRRSWVGILIAVMGAIFLTWNSLVVEGSGVFLGNTLALLSSVFLAIYFIGGRKYAKGLPNSVYTSVVYSSAALVTFIFCAILGINILVLDPFEIAIFLALAIFPTVLGHSVNNYLLTLVPAYIVSAAVLGEPIGATILGYFVLGEQPPAMTLVAFAIILFGVMLVVSGMAQLERNSVLSLDDTNGA